MIKSCIKTMNIRVFLKKSLFLTKNISKENILLGLKRENI